MGLSSYASCEKLSIAVTKNNYNKTKRILKKGTNPNCVFQHPIHGPISPLGQVALKKNTEILKLLVSYGVDLNTIINSDWDTTALHYAVASVKSQEDLDFVEQLIQLGASLEGSPKYKVSLLYTAVEKNSLMTVNYLLKKGLNPNNPEHIYKSPNAVFKTLGERNISLLKRFVEHGAIYSVFHNGKRRTLLYEASQKCFRKGVDIVVDNFKSKFTKEDLSYAAYNLLFCIGKFDNKIQSESKKLILEYFYKFIELGADYKIISNLYSNTALKQAIGWDFEELFDRLLAHVEDIDARFDTYQETVLYAAIEKLNYSDIHAKFVYKLLDAGADPNIGTHIGVTPLVQIALKNRRGDQTVRLNVIDELLKHGADPYFESFYSGSFFQLITGEVLIYRIDMSWPEAVELVNRYSNNKVN